MNIYHWIIFKSVWHHMSFWVRHNTSIILMVSHLSDLLSWDDFSVGPYMRGTGATCNVQHLTQLNASHFAMFQHLYFCCFVSRTWRKRHIFTGSHPHHCSVQCCHEAAELRCLSAHVIITQKGMTAGKMCVYDFWVLMGMFLGFFVNVCISEFISNQACPLSVLAFLSPSFPFCLFVFM